MDHDFSLILTFVGGLTAALLFGLIARKLHLSPLVGYLLAGVVVGPYSPGFVADSHTVEQFAELGVILLMFGVGLHFHLKDLIAVQRVAVPGAVVQISVATVLGVIVGWCFGWSTISGLVFGMAISVASTVVLTRVLEDHQNLHTPSGHVALGWLVVEDLFTILLLVLIPAVMEARQSGAGGWDNILSELGWMFVKLSVLVALTLFAGKKSFRWSCVMWHGPGRGTCLRLPCWSLLWGWRYVPPNSSGRPWCSVHFWRAWSSASQTFARARPRRPC